MAHRFRRCARRLMKEIHINYQPALQQIEKHEDLIREYWIKHDCSLVDATVRVLVPLLTGEGDEEDGEEDNG